MKKTKRLVAMMLSFAMILGCIPGLFSKAYAEDEAWTVEIYAEDKKIDPNDGIYENNGYRVLTYRNTVLDNTYDNCTYPRVSDPEYKNARYIVFGPFEITNKSNVKWGNKNFAFQNDISQNDIKNFYDSNKTHFNGFDVYRIQDTNKCYLVIPFASISVKPAVFVMCKNEGQVFQDKFSVTPGDKINLACIPKVGWTLDKYYWYDKDGNEHDIEGSTFTVPDNLTDSIYLDAKYNETLGRNLDLSYRYKTIQRVAELLNMDDQEKFVDYIITLPDHYEYLNSTKFMYDLIRPLYKELYSAPYENDTEEDVDSIKEYLEDISSLTPTRGYENTSDAKVSYAKRIVGLLMLSYYATFDEASEANKRAVNDTIMFDDFASFIGICNASSSNQIINEAFESLFKDSIGSMEQIATLSGDSVATSTESRPSPIRHLIDELDAEDVWLSWDSDNLYFDTDLERYQSYIKKFFVCMEPDADDQDYSVEDKQKYSELELVIDEEIFKWAANKRNYENVENDYNDDNQFFYRDALKENISNMKETLGSLSEGSEKNALKFEIIKEQIRLITREICEDKALIEALLFKGDYSKVCAVFDFDAGVRTNIVSIMSKIQDIKSDADDRVKRKYESIYDNDLYDLIITNSENASDTFAAAAISGIGNNANVTGYYDSLRDEMQSKARERKIVIEEVDGLYEYDNLGDINFNVYFEKNGNKTRIPTVIEDVYIDRVLDNKCITDINRAPVGPLSDYYYKIKIDYGQMPNLFVCAAPEMRYGFSYFEIDNRSGSTFNKFYPVEGNSYPDDAIHETDDGFIINVKPKRSMKIEITKVPELLYGENVSEVEDCTLTGIDAKIIFSNSESANGKSISLPYTMEVYKNSWDNKITNEQIIKGNNYFLKTKIDITDIDSKDIFANYLLGQSIDSLGDALDVFDMTTLDIGIYKNDTDTESSYIYQNYIDNEIVKVDVKEEDGAIYIYSYLPILQESEITDFSYVSNTSDTITFKVTGSNLANSYEIFLDKIESNGDFTDMGQQASTLNLMRFSDNYKIYEDEASIIVDRFNGGTEHLLTFHLSDYMKRKYGIDSFPNGNYRAMLNASYVSLDSQGGEMPVATISDVWDVDFTIGQTSSSKKYKAIDDDKTAEKISGTGKKGSKRTITPIEGKKVSDVIVKDKNGNKVDVTKNADGTYSFIQPASDVTVEVNYKNREIVLNIGSTDAYVDNDLNILDVAPLVRNDRTMLPIRFVAENLGAKVEWDEKNPEYVLITKGDIKIEITLGSDKAKVNGKEFTLDSVAFAENDRTYLPVRFVSEYLNAIVEWNEAKPMEVKIYER